ncbi:MAG: prepilin-type N-terminal cleavage/methylation domain-containing protein [Planctomycetes bacterium]|nr:prepilin-type N-terminal cleavage/methylation domain-containing protein [Planctomycetota bacterium]
MSPNSEPVTRDRAPEGFTLLEVLAALLIAAVALTFLIQSETSSLRISNEARDLREATLLASAKLQELIAGAEGAASGAIEGRENWTWEAAREPVPDGYGTEKIIVTLRYVSGIQPRIVTLEEIAP